MGIDACETRFHHAPIPDGVTQQPPRFQEMAQEWLTNQQQHQLQQLHLLSHQGATPRKELENVHLNPDDTSTLVVFIARDDALDTEDDEMDVTDHNLEDFKHFCL